MWVFPNSLRGIGIIMATDRAGTMDKRPDGSAMVGVSAYRRTIRLVEPSDTTFVHGLRTGPAFNRNLSVVTGDAADQRVWIEGYKMREAEGRGFSMGPTRNAVDQRVDVFAELVAMQSSSKDFFAQLNSTLPMRDL